jgi:nucleoid-associated protein YgaU
VDVIAERSPSKQAAGGKHTTKPGRGRTTYRVKAGDRSLAEIAARKDIYGDASQWKRIAKANGIRDPRSLKVGRVLKIPR